MVERRTLILGFVLPEEVDQGLDALLWFRKGAVQGHAASQNNLALLYQAGRGVPQDYAQAMEWLHRAAAQNDAPAQCNIGLAEDAPPQGEEGGSAAWLELDEALAPALTGIRLGQELVLLT